MRHSVCLIFRRSSFLTRFMFFCAWLILHKRMDTYSVVIFNKSHVQEDFVKLTAWRCLFCLAL